MIVYRLSLDIYKDDLGGTGAKLFGGRWNNIGVPALYTTGNISLAVLELLVRTDRKNIPLNHYLLQILIPDTESPIVLPKNKLKAGWKDDIHLTQWIGSEFMTAGESLILQVPSAVVDEEHNFIINPTHPHFNKLKIVSAKKFQFDTRLFLKNE